MTEPLTPLPVLEAAAARFVELRSDTNREGLLAEQRHQYLDLDPDSTCCLPGFTCVNCPPGGTT